MHIVILNLRNAFEPINSDSQFTVSRLASAFYAGMWPYDGWNSFNYIAEEVVDPGRAFPRVL